MLLQVVFFRPGDILNQKMTKHVPTADRIAFQSTSNEMLTILTKMASQNAGYHIDSITQVQLHLNPLYFTWHQRVSTRGVQALN